MKLISKPHMVKFRNQSHERFDRNKEWVCKVELSNGTEAILNYTPESDELFLISMQSDRDWLNIHFEYVNQTMALHELEKFTKKVNKEDCITLLGLDEYIPIHLEENTKKWM